MIFDELLCVGPSYNQPTFCSHATWHPSATTFANDSVIGMKPWGLFVDINNTIYVTDKSGNGRVRVWREGNMTLSRIISGNLSSPFAVFVTLSGNVYVDNGKNYSRVDMWTSASIRGVAIMNVNTTCYGLFVDLYNDLYCSVSDLHQVFKKSLNNDSNTTIAAGNGTRGSTSNMLNAQRGIFLDNNSNLYVADCGNDRIQLFLFGQLNATTVLGNGPTTTITLSCPIGIILDGDGYLFITDSGNNRIVGPGPNGYQCVAGCTGGNGSASDQLSYPRSLSFDSYGNIFVADGYNDRIQKFLLATNTCGNVALFIS